MSMKSLMDMSNEDLSLIVRGILNSSSGANYANETLLGIQANVVGRKPVVYTAFINFVAATTANYGVMGPDPNIVTDMAVAPFYIGEIDHSFVKDQGTPPATDQLIVRGFVGGTGLVSSTTYNKKVRMQGVAGPENLMIDSAPIKACFQAWRADVVFSAAVVGTYAFNFVGLQLDISGN